MPVHSPMEPQDLDASASSLARSTVLAAYLLIGDWRDAERVAARALAAAGPAPWPAQAAALARRFVRPRQSWWVRGGGLQLRETPGAATAEAPAEPDLWAALAQLDEVERAAIVLRHHAEFDVESIASAIRVGAADVEDALASAYAVLAAHARPTREATADGDLPARLHALFAAHGDLEVPTAAALRDADAYRRRRVVQRLTATATAVVAAAATFGVVVVNEARRHPTELPVAASPTIDRRHGREALPATEPGAKLVGFRHFMVGVPAAWAQRSGNCHDVRRDAVLYLTGSAPALCGDADLRPGVSVVAFAADAAGEPEVQGGSGARRSVSGRFVVSRPSQRGERYVAYTAAPSFGFGMSVTTSSLRMLNRIMDTMLPIPPGYATMPQCVGLSPTRMTRLVYGRGLIAQQQYDPSGVGMPSRVVQQSERVGTILPTRTQVTFAVLPR